MSDIAMYIAEIIIIAAIAALCRFGIPCAIKYVKNSNLSTASQWVKYAVLKAEQVFAEYTGAEKKKYVEDFVFNTLQSLKINIPKEQVDTLIESAVKQMNIEKQKMQSTQVTIEAQKVTNVALTSTASEEDVKAEIITPANTK
jgi:hypothetical protein